MSLTWDAVRHNGLLPSRLRGAREGESSHHSVLNRMSEEVKDGCAVFKVLWT
jgi:hypothetical protein